MNKIKEGALFGFGFAVIVILVSYVYSLVAMNLYGFDDYEFDQSTENVEILESRIEKRDDRLVVLGQYRNNGKADLYGLTISADFFGEDNTFLDQCEKSASEGLEAGAASYFRIDCSSCADLTLEEVANHEIKVTNAY